MSVVVCWNLNYDIKICVCAVSKSVSVCYICLFVWVYGISTFVGYLMPNPFLYKNQFYFKQFSLVLIHSSIVKSILLQAIQYSQIVLILTIQFSISIVFVFTQLNIITVLFWTIQFSVSTVSMSLTVPFQIIQFSINTLFESQNSFILGNLV